MVSGQAISGRAQKVRLCRAQIGCARPRFRARISDWSGSPYARAKGDLADLGRKHQKIAGFFFHSAETCCRTCLT